MSSHLALRQVSRIAQLCDFLEHPAMQAALNVSLPVSMPHDVGSLGFDTGLWVGFGIVGLWAALDAFAERAGIPQSTTPVCGRNNCVSCKLNGTTKLNAAEELALEEMEDLRHLFAHNYAGIADSLYFQQINGTPRRRHVLKSGVRASLSSGALFDGVNISFSIGHLRFYGDQARNVIEKLS